MASLIPSDQYLFPDFDWLIGNHSDELTPWIPVMAARLTFLECDCAQGMCGYTAIYCSGCVEAIIGVSYTFRSSYKTKYFVLPCCPHDFDGKVSL